MLSDRYGANSRFYRRATMLSAVFLILSASPALAQLEGRYDHSGLSHPASSPLYELEEHSGLSRRDKIIAAHAIAGYCAWQIFAPLAVLIAACGRSWGVWWFRLHWMIHIFLTVPLTVAVVVLGCVAAQLGPKEPAFDRHKTMGFAILLALWVQISVGYWAVLKHRLRFASSPKPDEGVTIKVPSRNTHHYVHIALGVCLLVAGATQVSWGFVEYELVYGPGSIPKWFIGIHWLLVGLPIFFSGSFFIMRGLIRIHKGQTFSQAFLNSTPTPRTPPPRKLWLVHPLDESKVGMESPRFKHLEYEAEEGGGYTYERGSGRDGARKLSTASNGSLWPGAATREEYEDSIKASSVGHGDNYVETEESSLLPVPSEEAVTQPSSTRASLGSLRSEAYTADHHEDVAPRLAIKQSVPISSVIDSRKSLTNELTRPAIPPRPVNVPLIRPPVPRSLGAALSTVMELETPVPSRRNSIAPSNVSTTLYLPKGNGSVVENPWSEVTADAALRINTDELLKPDNISNDAGRKRLSLVTETGQDTIDTDSTKLPSAGTGRWFANRED